MVYCLPATEVASFIEANYLAEYTASIEDGRRSHHGRALDGGRRRALGRHLADPPRHAPFRNRLPRRALARDTSPGPTTPPARRSSSTSNYASEYMPLRGRSLKPTAGPAPGPDTQEALVICQDEYRIEWDRVQDLADLDFDGYVGYVNEYDFLQDGDAGTLLIVGRTRRSRPMS